MAKEHILHYQEMIALNEKMPGVCRVTECHRYKVIWHRILMATLYHNYNYEQIQDNLGDLYSQEIWDAFYDEPDRYGCSEAIDMLEAAYDDGNIPSQGNEAK